jgi:hypothetical protein
MEALGNAGTVDLTLIFVKWLPTLRVYSEATRRSAQFPRVRSCSAPRKQTIEGNQGSWPQHHL